MGRFVLITFILYTLGLLFPLCLSTSNTTRSCISDVVIALEQSTSMRADEFTVLKLLALMILHSFPVYGPNGVQVGLLKYSDTSTIIFNTTTYSTTDDASRAIATTRFDGGLTRTHPALRDMLSMLQLSRPGVKKVGILTTDGHPDDEIATTAAADSLKASGAELIVFSFGKWIDTSFYERLASSPKHYFKIEQFALDNISLPLIGNLTCGETTYTTSTSSSTTTNIPRTPTTITANLTAHPTTGHTTTTAQSVTTYTTATSSSTTINIPRTPTTITTNITTHPTTESTKTSTGHTTTTAQNESTSTTMATPTIPVTTSTIAPPIPTTAIGITTSTQTTDRTILPTTATPGIYNHTCDFEHDLCGWSIDALADFFWIRHTGCTPSSSTGPCTGHGGYGYYVYIEASAKSSGARARLISPVFDKNATCLVFWYHMYGASIGALRVYITPGSLTSSPKRLIWQRWHSSDNWYQSIVYLSPFLTNLQSFRIVFDGTVGSSYTGDIALDDINILPCSAMPTTTTTTTTVTTTTARRCGGSLTWSSGIISSPGYPSNYPPRTVCIWYITVRTGNVIRLQFTSFNLQYATNCIYDYVEVYNTLNTLSWYRIGRYCGYSTPTYITSSSNTMTVKFVSDASGGNYSGFRATYTTVYVTTRPTRPPTTTNTFGCGGTLRSSSGILTSPRYPLSYPNNAGCTWFIRVQTGMMIRLHFTSFNLEPNAGCSYDYVEVYDTTYISSGNNLGRFCGSSIPPDITTSSNTMAVKFVSDGSGTYRGFRAYYTSFNNVTTVTRTTTSTTTGTTTTPIIYNSHSCGFENNFCGWQHNASAGFRWKLRSGPTNTNGTGPTSGHGGHGYYAYFEATAGTRGNRAALVSPVFHIDATWLTFWYHMYGQNVGALVLYITPGASLLPKKQIWLEYGSKGDQWNRQTINLLIHTWDITSFRLVFEGVIGIGVKGDIALDDISLQTNRPVTRVTTTTPVTNQITTVGATAVSTPVTKIERNCTSLESPAKARFSSPTCTKSSTPSTQCVVICEAGYTVYGQLVLVCLDSGQWSGDSTNISCVDIQPPKLTCRDVVVTAKRGDNKANVTWTPPTSTDNSGLPVLINQSEISPSNRIAGVHQVSVSATDQAGNKAHCIFNIIVKVLRCAHPTLPAHTSFHGGCDYIYGRTCKLDCAPGYTHEGTDGITCEKNGSKMFWDMNKFNCRQLRCKDPTLPSRMTIVGNCLYVQGSTCLLGCETGYELEGSERILCEMDGPRMSWKIPKSSCRPTDSDTTGGEDKPRKGLETVTIVLIAVVAFLAVVIIVAAVACCAFRTGKKTRRIEEFPLEMSPGFANPTHDKGI